MSKVAYHLELCGEEELGDHDLLKIQKDVKYYRKGSRFRCERSSSRRAHS